MFKGLGDVAAEADVARLYSEAVEKLGGIDVAVLNAGVGRHGNIEDISVEDFDLQFNTNVRGVFLWLKHILPHMKVLGLILEPLTLIVDPLVVVLRFSLCMFLLSFLIKFCSHDEISEARAGGVW